jgi:hypothetical protein
MKKRILLLSTILTVFMGTSLAQTSNVGNPLTHNGKIQKTKSFYATPAIDIESELAAQVTSGEKMMRFGKEFTVDLNVVELASKTILPSGDIVYQFGIECPNAVSVNLVFDNFYLPAGAKLFITDAKSNEFIGAYTSFNNNQNKMLGTEVLYTSKIIVELVEPKNTVGSSQLSLGTIVSGFRNLDEMMKALNDSGNCHYDANCPEGATWVNQKNSVAMMVNGGGFCTGALVNNTSGTIIPYFLSANHCGTNPGGWVFRFRWESPSGQAVCGTGANSVNGPVNMNVNGGVLRAAYAGSDVTLTELNTAPNPAWGIYYSGWDKSGTAVSSAVGIHHPSGDIKKISFENSALTSSSWAGSPANSHWHVPGWDLGVTEPGSSGSPLFDQNRRVIGQLHGGASACGANDLSDEYGKFSLSWTGNNTNSTRLSNWLDPSNTGASAIDGVDPAGPGASLDAAINNPQGVSGTYCTATVTPQVTITNSGTDVLTAATISYGYDGVLNQTYPWTGSLAQYQTVTITLPAATLAGGNHTFSAEVINPNGSTDQNLANNTVSSSFTTVLNGQTVSLDLNIDCWGSETSWELLDAGNAVLYAGNGYADESPMLVEQDFCLDYGCYTFKLMDSYGDGLTNCNSGNGSYTITRNGVVLAQLLQADADFGTEISNNFCLINDAGLAESTLASSVNVFPNPADEQLAVVSKGIELQKIELMNIAGQVIRTNLSNDMVVTMHVADVASGVYLVRIYTAQGSTTKQVVIN